MKCSSANPSIHADLPSLVSFKLLRTSLAVIPIWDSESTASIWLETKPFESVLWTLFSRSEKWICHISVIISGY